MRVSRGGRAALLAAFAGLLLAGCADVVDGDPVAGSSTAQPTPQPTPSSTSVTPTGFPTASTSASSTTVAPTTPSTTTAGGPLARTPITTQIGDPVVKDFCRGQGTSVLEPLGYDVEYSSVQYAGGCSYRLMRNGASQFDVFESSNPPSTAPTRTGGSTTSVGGFRVYKVPYVKADTTCTRDISAPGIVITIQGFAISGSPSSPVLCKSADLVVQSAARFLSEGASAPSLALSTPTSFGLDMCKVATAARLSDSPLLSGATPRSKSYGAECLLSNAKVSLYFDLAVVDPSASTTKNTIVVVGSHRLLAPATASKSYCTFSARQDATGSGARVEEIDVSMSSLSYEHPPANMCATTQQLVGKFLDTGNLK